MDLYDKIPRIHETKSFLETGRRLNPYQVLTLAFAALILLGTVLLMLPQAVAGGEPLPFVDALFTATSAVCVTGLVVVDTGTYFSLFGQLVVIFLIQLGALGILTVAGLMSVMIRRRLTLGDRILLQEALNHKLTLSGIVHMIKSIVIFTFWTEFIGGTFLAARFAFDFGWQGVYFGYWHAVSAFCNAGFDVIGIDNGGMGRYVGDVAVNFLIPQLIIIGGIGFPVIKELLAEKNIRHCSLHTQMVLFMTFLLNAAGMLAILGVEWNNAETLGNLSWPTKVMAAYFQSVTLRTAGFATIDLSSIYPATILLMIAWMFIGASPGSTGGGIKTTTAAVLFMEVWNEVRGNQENKFLHWRIPMEAGRKAFTVALASLFLVVGFGFLLCVTDETHLQGYMILFEAVSAFSTTGLSMGITSQFSDFSKLCITLLMFIGRVGTMTFVMALVFRQKKALIKHPEGKIMIG